MGGGGIGQLIAQRTSAYLRCGYLRCGGIGQQNGTGGERR
jgi:hypothetical protein